MTEMKPIDTYIVYQHVNLINNKKYIGITKRTVEERWGNKGSNYSTTPRFWNAIKKYGWDNFSHEVLYSGLTKDEACEIEIKLIKENKTQDRNYGYNIMSGGESPSIPLEVRKILSELMKGNKNGLGKVCSEEKKKKISEAQKGKKLTKEHCMKLSLAKKGRHHKTISEESKKKISNSHRKNPVYCKELNKIFPSIQECARQLNMKATNICAVCKGKHKTHKGFHFCYYNNIEMPNDHLHKNGEYTQASGNSSLL